MKVMVDGKENTAQVKPYNNVVEDGNMIRIEGSANVKKYKTDWMVFVRRGNEILVLDNSNSEIRDGYYYFPKDSVLYQF
jgi:hypothetical protein